MKKLFMFVAVAVLMVFSWVPSFAAIGDVSCFGTTTNGWCYKSTGHLLPNTSALQNIGSSSYKIGTMFIKNATYYGELVMASGSTLTINAAANIGISATPSFTSISLTGGASGTTLDFSGNVHFGAANYISTITASNGNMAVTGNIVSLGNISGVVVGASGAITGATTIAVQGASYFGSNANATVSTIPANGAAVFATSVSAPAIIGTTSIAGGTISGTTIVASSYVQHASKTLAEIMATTATVVGQDYYCSNCTVDTVATSTGTSTCLQWAGNTSGRGAAVILH